MPGWAGALGGLVAGGVALGVAQLVAGVTKPEAFPVVAVGNAVVDLTPAPLKEWAIRTFGESDKAALVGGVFVALVAVAAGIGALARRSAAVGRAGFAAVGLVGLAAVVTRPGAGLLDVAPVLVGVAAGMWTLEWLLRRAGARAEGGPARRTGEAGPLAGTAAAPPRPSDDVGAPAETEGSGRPAGIARSGETVVRAPQAGPAANPAANPEVRERAERPAVMRSSEDGRPVFNRRGLLVGAAGGVVAAGASAALGRMLSAGREAETARVAVSLPRPARAAGPLPAGVDFRIPGLSPFVTSNRDFYRVDTALLVPRVEPREWTLRIHGLVDRPVELTYADLLRRPLMEADVTLTCVSNEVGGPYVGNARWLGVRMADVLREAGIRSEADMLLSTSHDGWTCGTPVDVVMDGRNALFAIAMNGEPLPLDHGFPVRQVVPGLYGYVSATKWVVDIKVTRFDQDEAYWTPRGWAARAPIKTQSRIDVPRNGASVPPGRTKVAGVAWAQHTGIAAVEVRIDGGAWRQAALAEVPGPDTWRQWALDWDAAPGEHVIEVRATDAAGRTQPEQRTSPAPDGATGWHSVTVRVG